MHRFLPAIASVALLFGTAASGQVTSYVSNNPAPQQVKGDPNKVVCEKQDEIGSRVRFTKICMTVHEWQMREKDDRDFTAQAQAGVCVPQAGCNDSVAMDGTGPRAPAAGPH